MQNSGIGLKGEGELRSNRLTEVHLEKWPLKRSVCVTYLLTYLLTYVSDYLC